MHSELTDMTVTEVSEKIRSGLISVPEAVEAVYENIKAREDELGCYITLDIEGAKIQAEKVQELITCGTLNGPLAGAVIAVKDNICTKGLRTTCASKMLENFIPFYDAEAVRRLKEAGCIIIGKTNMDEFAMGSTTETSAFGSCKNPVNPAYVPGGSSGGSAAAVAAGEAFAALGSDTGGSVRQPAAFCGVYGLKPTYGMISRYGLIAYASSMDHIGILAKSSDDCAAMLSVLAGYDEKDSTCVNREYTGFFAGKRQSANVRSLKGLRAGIIADHLEGASAAAKKAVYDTEKALRSLGAETEEMNVGLSQYAVAAYYLIADAEASSNLARYDGVKYGFRSGNIPKDADLQRFYEKTRGEGFGEEVKRRIMLGTFALSEGFYDKYYLKALKVRRLIKDAYEKAFSKYDILIGPVCPGSAPKAGESLKDPLNMYLQDVYTVPANLTGMPAMSIPAGRDENGMPVGVQLYGNYFSEGTLITAAAGLETI